MRVCGVFGFEPVLCCDVWYVMCGRITFSSVFAITDKMDIGLHDVPILMSLLGLRICMMLASFHT